MNDAIFDSPAGTLMMMDGANASMSTRPTVRQLVAQRLGRARVFEKYGLSYCCCGGNLSIEAACAKNGVDPRLVLADLRASDMDSQRPSPEPNVAALEVAELARLTICVHGLRLRLDTERLCDLLAQVAERHGELYPELWELQRVLGEFSDRLEQHLRVEEDALLPLLLHAASALVFANVVARHKCEHALLSGELNLVTRGIQDLLPSDRACNTHRVLRSGLEELQAELGRHIAWEEEHLFPRALQHHVEAQLTNVEALLASVERSSQRLQA